MKLIFLYLLVIGLVLVTNYFLITNDPVYLFHNPPYDDYRPTMDLENYVNPYYAVDYRYVWQHPIRSIGYLLSLILIGFSLFKIFQPTWKKPAFLYSLAIVGLLAINYFLIINDPVYLFHNPPYHDYRPTMDSENFVNPYYAADYRYVWQHPIRSLGYLLSLAFISFSLFKILQCLTNRKVNHHDNT